MKCPHCGKETDEQADSLFPTNAAPDRRSKGNGASRSARRSSLPADWLPTADQEKYCRQQGKVVSDCLQAFREYYLAKGTVWKDWGLVWMKWCRTWQPAKDHKQAATAYAAEPWLARLKDYAPGKFWSPMWGGRPGEPNCRVPKELLRNIIEIKILSTKRTKKNKHK